MLVLVALVVALVVCPLHALPGLRRPGVEEAGGAVRAVLKASAPPRCSVILLSHAPSSPAAASVADEVTQRGQWGVVVLTVAPYHNTTTPAFTRALSHAYQVRRKAWCVTVVVVGEDVAFLQRLAQESRRVRLLTWAVHLLVVTPSLTPAAAAALITAHWTFSMMNTVFLHPDSLRRPSRWEAVALQPYSGQGPRLLRVATWKSQTGLVSRHPQLFPSKYNNFHGEEVPVTALILPPFWKVVNPLARDSWSMFSGRDCLILKAVARALNFTFRMHKSSNIDEVMTSLQTGDAIMSCFRVMLIPQVLQRIDFSYFLERATFTFSMAVPSKVPEWQALYYPFTLTVWLGILLCLLLVPGVLYQVMYSEGDEVVRRNLRGRSVTLETAGLLFGQVLHFRLPKTTGARMLVIWWLIFAFVVSTGYRGTLTAFLSVPKYPSRPENIQQLAKTDARIFFVDNATRFLQYFLESNLSAYRSVGLRAEMVDSYRQGMTEALEHRAAYFHERYNSELLIAENFVSRSGSHLLYVARQNVIPNFAAWMMPHDAPYKTVVNQWLLTIIEAGLKDKFTEDMLRESWLEIRQRQQEGNNLNNSEVSSERDNNALGLTQLQGAFWVVAFGYFFALLSFLVELVLLPMLRVITRMSSKFA